MDNLLKNNNWGEFKDSYIQKVLAMKKRKGKINPQDLMRSKDVPLKNLLPFLERIIEKTAEDQEELYKEANTINNLRKESSQTDKYLHSATCCDIKESPVIHRVSGENIFFNNKNKQKQLMNQITQGYGISNNSSRPYKKSSTHIRASSPKKNILLTEFSKNKSTIIKPKEKKQSILPIISSEICLGRGLTPLFFKKKEFMTCEDTSFMEISRQE